MPAARSRVAVIFFTVLIDLIGFGIIIPILPYYAQRLGAGGLGLGALLGVFSAMQFVATASHPVRPSSQPGCDLARQRPWLCSVRGRALVSEGVDEHGRK